MKKLHAEPTRFRELPPEEDLVSVAELIREAAVPPELGPAARRRIRERLRRGLDVAPSRAPRWRLRLRVAVVAVVALVGAGAGGAAVQSMIARRSRGGAVVEVAPPVPPAPAGHQRRHRARPAPAPADPDLDAEVASEVAAPDPPAPAAAATVASAGDPATIAQAARRPPSGVSGHETKRQPSAPRVMAALEALAPPATAPAIPPVAVTPPPWHPEATAAPRPEAALLAEAIRKLRAERDPDAALALLDERGARFPSGPLSLEAAAIRVEALLVARRPWAALAELDRLPLDAVPSPDDWRVLRGELRAMAGRWREADADFGAALSGRLGEAGGDFAERALWGRAVARDRLGDASGARADYDQYLARFPAGRFAAEAHRARRPSEPADRHGP